MVSTICFATSQIPDYLIYKGKSYEWKGYSPGYNYIEKTGLPIPIEALETSANTRLIMLTYTIENNLLYLSDIEIFVDGEIIDKELSIRDLVHKSIFNYYFPNQEKILMDQYTEVKVAPNNIITADNDEAHIDPVYEKYLVFQTKNGKVEKSYEVDYRGLKKLRHKSFKELKKSSIYEKEKLERYDDYESLKEHYPKLTTIDKYLEHFIFKWNIYQLL